MDITASVDLGNNISGLIEKLAAQIGTTADKVFPWYVQQAYVEGITTLIALCIFYVVILAIGIPAFFKADLENVNKWTPVALSCLTLALLGLLPLSIEGTESVRKIVNPNYYAMKMLTRDVGLLSGR